MARKKKTDTDNRKALAYLIIPPKGDPGETMYGMLRDVVIEHHDDDLRDAKIALAWAKNWKPDTDGRLKLGSTKIIGDPERELTKHDILITVNQGFWQHEDVTDEMRLAMLHHQLCYVTLRYDNDGEPQEDEKERKVYRNVKPDVVEFTSVVRNYGFYTKDLEKFAEAVQNNRQGSLFARESKVVKHQPKANGSGHEAQPSA